ncbi:MAG: hypothetical protein KC652_05510 [Cyanobacteria bacterium HKST-UBA01]|nr:hypothetical protein [Cyanobacteria bacterium HKST-UBA01]
MPNKYEFFYKTVSVKGVIVPVPTNPLPSPPPSFPSPGQVGNVSRALRYVVVDIKRMFVTPLLRGTDVKTDEYTDLTKVFYNKDLPNEAYRNLKLVTNGTFNLGNLPAGHLVYHSYSLARKTFEKIPHYWTTVGAHDDRWYFAVDNAGSYSIGRTPPWPSGVTTPSQRENWLKRNFKWFMHGGAILFSSPSAVSSDVHAYRTAFNSTNDIFNGLDAYQGINSSNSALTEQMFYPKPRWALAELTDGTLLIAQTSKEGSLPNGMTIHEFAQAVAQISIPLVTPPGSFATPVRCIMFDGGSHQGFHACNSLDEIIAVSPGVIAPQRTQPNPVSCHFGVFDIRNVGIRKIGSELVPKDYKHPDLLRVAINNAVKKLDIKYKIRKTDYFKHTEEVVIRVMAHKFSGLPVLPPPGNYFEIKHMGTVIPYDQEKNWSFSDAETLVIAERSSQDPVGAAIIIESYSASPRELISRDIIAAEIATGHIRSFILDNSYNLDSSFLNARDSSANIIGTGMLLVSKLKESLDPVHSYPTKLGVVATAKPATAVQNWTDAMNDFQDAFPLSVGLVDTDYNNVLVEISRFNTGIVSAGRERSAYWFAGTDHFGGSLDDSLIRPLVGDKIRTHCIVSASVSLQNKAFLKKVAGDTNGHYEEISSPDTILDAFNRAYAKEQAVVIPQSFAFDLPSASSSRSVSFALATEDTATIQIYSKNQAHTNFEVSLEKPDGTTVDLSNAASFPEIRFVKYLNIVVIIIFNPVSQGTNWKVNVVRSIPFHESSREAYSLIMTVREESQSQPDTTPVPSIVFENPLVPKTVRQAEGITASVEVANDSLPPESVTLHIKYQEQSQYRHYPFIEDPDTGLWKVDIPGEFFSKTGVVVSYIEGTRDEYSGVAPDGAPEEVFTTQVKSPPSKFLPWILEYADKSYGNDFFKVRLSLRNEDGTEKLSAGNFVVSSQYWFGKHHAIDRSAMISDPVDQGVWIFSAGTVSPAPKDFRLQKVLPDGQIVKTIPVTHLIRSITLDVVRNRIWAISSRNSKTIVTIDLESGKENAYTQDKDLLCIAVDRNNGDIFTGGSDHIYKLDSAANMQPFYSAIRGCWQLCILPGGEILAKAAVHVPDTPPHNIEPTVLWLNSNGGLKSRVQSYGMGYEIFAHDNISNDVWLLDGINRPISIIRYDSRLRAELSVVASHHNLRHFDSVSLDHKSGGVWVTGEDRYGKGFFGRVNLEGALEQIGSLGTPALISQLIEPIDPIQEVHLPEIVFDGYDVSVSAATTTGALPPSKVIVRTSGVSNKTYDLKPTGSGIWNGVIPSKDLKPGLLKSFLTASVGNGKVLAPRGAPEALYETDIQQSSPIWVCEHKGTAFNEHYLKARIRFLNSIGEEKFSAGSFTVPADPRQNVMFASAALTVDADDGSVWVFHAQSVSDLRLVNIKPDGNKRDVKVSNHLTYCAVDSHRNVLWGGSHLSGAKLVAINRDSGSELASWSFEAWSLDVDPSTGDCLAWGWGPDQRRGIFRFKVGASPELLRADNSPCRELQVISGGRFVAIHDYFDNATRIVIFDGKGKVLQYSRSQPGYSLTSAQSLVFDSKLNRAWILTASRGILMYDFKAEEFYPLPRRYADFRNFEIRVPNSITLNPGSGGAWLSARTSSGNVQLFYIDNAGRALRLDDFDGAGEALVRSGSVGG